MPSTRTAVLTSSLTLLVWPGRARRACPSLPQMPPVRSGRHGLGHEQGVAGLHHRIVGEAERKRAGVHDAEHEAFPLVPDRAELLADRSLSPGIDFAEAVLPRLD